MKMLIISILTVFSLCAAPVAAQSDTLSLGYCNGQYNQSTKIASSGKGYVEAAVRLPKESLTAYRGNSLVGVRAAIVERINTDTLRVWVRSSLTGENIAQGYVLRQGTGGIVKGWNSVRFDSPLTITDGLGDVYVGYSLHHKASVSAVSLVDRKVDNSSFVRVNKADWQDYSDQGMVCVEALVAGDHIPAYDLGLGVSTVVPAPAAGEYALKGTTQVHNYGAKAVAGFTLELAAGGYASRTLHVDGTLESLADTTVAFAADMGAAFDENTKWTLRLVSIDSADDENDDNNTTQPVYKFQKNVLIEEFTTEKCVNCPRAAGYLHEVLESDDYKDRVVAIARHAGFYTDWLTQPCDDELTWFYNNGGNLYAPAMMFNRKPFFEISAGKSTAVVNPQSADFIKAYCQDCMDSPANAMLDLKLEFNADSTSVDVTVGGLCTSLYNTANARLCLVLLENEVKARNQTGADGVYMQQHVNRGYNSTWGEPVEWSDRRFSYSFTFQLDPSWVKANMEVAAFLYNYDADDPTNCEVDNSAMTKLVGQGSGTATSVAESIKQNGENCVVGEYDLSGVRVKKANSPGLVIVKMSDGTVRKQLR